MYMQCEAVSNFMFKIKKKKPKSLRYLRLKY